MHAQSDLAPDLAPDLTAARAEHRAAGLDELFEIGMDAARFVQRAIRAANAAADTAAAASTDDPNITQTATTLAAAYDQVARAIRRTAHLAQHPDPAPAKPARTPAAETAAIKRRILREVGDQIERKAIDADEAEALHDEFHERFDAPDIDEDIGHRPTEDIILDIWRDLGLAYVFNNGEDGPRTVHTRSPAKIRALCARAGTPPRPPPGTADRILHLVTPKPPPPSPPD